MPRNGFFFLFMMPVKAAATCDRVPGGERRPARDSGGGNGSESRQGCGAGLPGTSAPLARGERPLAPRRDSSGGGRCRGAERACVHLTAPARAPARARGHAHPPPPFCACACARVCTRSRPNALAWARAAGCTHERTRVWALAHAPACTCAPARTRLCARAHAPPVCTHLRARAARVFSPVSLPFPSRFPATNRETPRRPARAQQNPRAGVKHPGAFC